MSWTVVAAAGFADDPAHAARWCALHRAGAGSPLLALEFAAAALAVFGRGDECLAWYGDADTPRIMALLAPAGRGRWQTFQPSQAPVGFWLQRDPDIAPERLASLLRALPGPALMLGLTQCDPMLAPRPPDAGAVRTLDYIETARISIDGSFDAYWEGRGKNLRANLRKQRKRLQQDGIPTRLEEVRGEAAMAAAVDDYGRLESEGWKGASGTAVNGANAQGRFYRLLLESFARRDAASVYRYWIGGRLAAMDLCIEGGGCVVVLKTAYDEQHAQQLSPALLMREEASRAIFDGGRVERIEFYGRVMEWHRRWSDEIRVMYHLNAYRWPWLARLHARASRAPPASPADAGGSA